jgi:hypothetical protein
VNNAALIKENNKMRKQNLELELNGLDPDIIDGYHNGWDHPSLKELREKYGYFNIWGGGSSIEPLTVDFDENMSPLYRATERVYNSPALLERVFYLLEYEWDNWGDHVEWVLTAPEAELIEWADGIVKEEAAQRYLESLTAASDAALEIFE